MDHPLVFKDIAEAVGVLNTRRANMTQKNLDEIERFKKWLGFRNEPCVFRWAAIKAGEPDHCTTPLTEFAKRNDGFCSDLTCKRIKAENVK